MMTLGIISTLAFLTATGGAGVAVLRRLARWGVDGPPDVDDLLTPFEQVVYGVPLGMIVCSYLLVPLASAFGLSGRLVIALGLGALATALALRPIGAVPAGWYHPAALLAGARRAASLLVGPARWPTLVIGAFAICWAFYWRNAIVFDAQGMWAGQQYIGWDWSVHLGDTAAFAYADNFPPKHPRFADIRYGYHYLTSLTGAAVVSLGLRPWVALPLLSFLGSIVVALGLYTFARRLSLSPGAATLALALFLLGGGFGWLLIVGTYEQSHNLWDTLLYHSWDFSSQQAHNFRWENVDIAALAPQRAYLYGLPLALLVFTLLLGGIRTGRARPFVVAGAVAGFLPLAHLGTLLALALIVPCLTLLFFRHLRGWLLFGAIWIALTVPQLLYQQQGSGRGPTAAIHWQIGWMAPPDNWLWFWFKNLGLFVPLFALALADRALLPPHERRFLWASLPAFGLANLIVFQPADYDNAKIFIYWFLSVCLLVAALLDKLWREGRGNAARALLVGLVVTLILPGLLAHLYTLRGNNRLLLLNTEEIQLGEAVRELTPPGAVFVVGLQNHHPVSTIAGRRVVVAFPVWLWTNGLDTGPRERDVRAIYAFDPDTPSLLRKYQVDYVVIGPNERQNFKVNFDAFHANYSLVFLSQNYQIFKVR